MVQCQKIINTTTTTSCNRMSIERVNIFYVNYANHVFDGTVTSTWENKRFTSSVNIQRLQEIKLHHQITNIKRTLIGTITYASENVGLVHSEKMMAARENSCRRKMEECYGKPTALSDRLVVASLFMVALLERGVRKPEGMVVKKKIEIVTLAEKITNLLNTNKEFASPPQKKEKKID